MRGAERPVVGAMRGPQRGDVVALCQPLLASIVGTHPARCQVGPGERTGRTRPPQPTDPGRYPGGEGHSTE